MQSHSLVLGSGQPVGSGIIPCPQHSTWRISQVGPRDIEPLLMSPESLKRNWWLAPQSGNATPNLRPGPSGVGGSGIWV